MRITKQARRIVVLVVAATFATGISAQQVVYPAKGQKPEQQKKDEGECHRWAVDNSKYDPTNPPKQAAAPPPPTTATGTTPGAGARGAARGAVIAEATGGDRSDGAAIGAAAARGQSRRQNAAAGQQQQQAVAQQDQAGMANYQKARAACLEGRGYTVK
jgi:hypothetical protein